VLALSEKKEQEGREGREKTARAAYNSEVLSGWKKRMKEGGKGKEEKVFPKHRGRFCTKIGPFRGSSPWRIFPKRQRKGGKVCPFLLHAGAGETGPARSQGGFQFGRGVLCQGVQKVQERGHSEKRGKPRKREGEYFWPFYKDVHWGGNHGRLFKEVDICAE